MNETAISNPQFVAVCPYCGDKNLITWELNFGIDSEGECETECKKCGKEYLVVREITIMYISYTVPEGETT